MFSSSSATVVRTPHVMSPEDLENLLEFFDILAMQRFIDHFQHQVALYTNYFRSLSSDEAPVKVDLTTVPMLDVIDKSIDLFKKLFASTSKSEIIANFTNLGFDRFEAKSVLISQSGIPANMLTKYLDYITRQVEVPDNKKQAFLDTIDIMSLGMDAGTWNL